MRAFLLLLLVAAPTWGASVAVCDPSHPSTIVDVVTEYRRSVNTPDYDSNPDALINPDVSAVDGLVPRQYWVCNRGGNSVVEMSAGDKITYDAWVVAQNDLNSSGVGDSGCLQNTLGSEINGSASDNTVPWDTEMTRPPWKERTYTHTGQAIAFCTDKAGLYRVWGALELNAAAPYRGAVKIRKNGTPDAKRTEQMGAQGATFHDVWRSDGDDCVSIAVDRVADTGSVTLESGSHVCMTKLSDVDTP